MSTLTQVVETLHTFDSYRTDSIDERRRFYADRLRLGNKFVAGRVGERLAFAPSRFAGYASCTLERHVLFAEKDGRVTNRALKGLMGDPVADDDLEAAYVDLCHEVGVEPAKRQKRGYWSIGEDIELEPVVRYAGGDYPTEVLEYVEGATRQFIANAHERNPAARRACIAHYGHRCSVCGLDFEEAYGVLGHGFIHVHHLTPLSMVKREQSVDPIAELRPVCPNCHAMLHRSDPPLTIEELQAVLVT